ncbi:hypothetical protein TNCV_850841 [Trichonephila clavipes]|nr:hypothetical protein TNCV_850841 [Trichonephila clavipes]
MAAEWAGFVSQASEGVFPKRHVRWLDESGQQPQGQEDFQLRRLGSLLGFLVGSLIAWSPNMRVTHSWESMKTTLVGARPAASNSAVASQTSAKTLTLWTATAGSDVVKSGRPIFDDFFQHLWPYIGNNTANVVFQMVECLWLIRIDQ